MKITKYILSFTFLLVVLCAEAQQLRKEAFDLLNLDYPGLERVKAACDRQQWDEAAKALLDYYRQRTGIGHPDIDMQNIKISKEEQKWADDALEHTFFVHKGYQPSYNYGKDINWQYWPVQDNELRCNCTATNGSPQWVRHIESLETRNMLKNGHTNIWIGLKRIL